MKLTILIILSLFTAFLSFNACLLSDDDSETAADGTTSAETGGASDTSGSESDAELSDDELAPIIESLASLPKATSPMASSSSAFLKSYKALATSGMNLSETDSSFFGEQSSRGACEIFNLVRQGINSAAQADQILCYVSNMSGQDAFASILDSDDLPIDVYDNDWHIFNLGIDDGDPYSPSRIKMKIDKNEAGSITSFEMFMCFGQGADMVQREYTSQAISGTGFTMRAIGHFVDFEGEGSHSVDVVGSLNSDGAFTEKTITVANVGTWGGNLNWQEGVLTQQPGRFYFQGYQSGNWSQGDEFSGSYSNAAYALGEILGDSSSLIQDLAIGDGAVHFSSLGTFASPDFSGSYQDEATDSWNGDNGAHVEENDFTITASGIIPPEVEAQFVLDFAANETWDCTDDVGVGIYDLSLDQAGAQEMDAECAQYMLSWEWINCYELIDQQNEQPQDQEQEQQQEQPQE